METFDAIKDLWQTQEINNLPDINEVKISIAKFRNKRKLNFYLLISALVAAVIVMLWVTFSYQTSFWTTRVGEMLFFATVVFVIYLKIKTNKEVNNDELLDTNAFLTRLKTDKLESCTGSSNQQFTAFLMLGISYFFYLYEFISARTASLITGYLIFIAVLALMWFVYRPLVIRYKRNSIEQFLHKIETIKNQNS